MQIYKLKQIIEWLEPYVTEDDYIQVDEHEITFECTGGPFSEEVFNFLKLEGFRFGEGGYPSYSEYLNLDNYMQDSVTRSI